MISSSSLTRYVLARACAFWREESGASSSEYGIIAGLVAIAIVPAIGLAGWRVTQTFAAIADATPTGSIPASAVPGNAPSAPLASGSTAPDSTAPVDALPPAPVAPDAEVYPIPN